MKTLWISLGAAIAFTFLLIYFSLSIRIWIDELLWDFEYGVALWFNGLDMASLGFFPVWSYLQYHKKHPDARTIFRYNLLTLTVILLAWFIGFMILWAFCKPDSPLLPDYISVQPFPMYWTLCTLVGIGTLLGLRQLVKARS